ncbi:MAG: OsmC family protein [Planctomycetota bacterium]
MSVKITGKYVAGLKTEMIHGPSGKTLMTAAPVDNQGDGSSFSPTDLVVTALGSCMVTIMGIVAQRNQIKIDGLRFEMEKHMETTPRRVGRIPIRIYMPTGLSLEDRKRLEQAASTCPVAQTLHPDVKKEVQFIYPD